MTSPASEGGEAARIRARLADLAKQRAALEARLAALQDAPSTAPDGDPAGSPVTDRSPSEAKIALFRSLFAGREDVFPRRWENARTSKAGYAPACANEWKPGLCGKPRVRCGACPNQAFLPVTDEEIAAHLRGRHTIGVYPLLPDGTCRFLVADFNKATWRRDTGAFLDACRSTGMPAALERSRSGNGGHVWMFFSEPVSAALARRLGSHLLTEAMARHADIGFGSYDQFFPSQDTVDYADKLPPKPVVHFCAAAQVHIPAAVDNEPMPGSDLSLFQALNFLYRAAGYEPQRDGSGPERRR